MLKYSSLISVIPVLRRSKIRVNRIVILLGLLLVATSCHTSRNSEKHYQSLGQAWSSKNTLTFEISNVSDFSKQRFDIFILLRNNEFYPFNNIFLIAKIRDSLNVFSVDTLEYLMTNKQGKWLGKGYTSIKESKLIFKENYSFFANSPLIIEIRHALRKLEEEHGMLELPGILDVGVEVVETAGQESNR